MATNPKTPLQAIVGVICDCLHDLPPEDQTRALDAVRVTLGLRVPTRVPDRNPFQEARPPLPTVEVQMVSDRPVVVNPPTDTTAPGAPRQRLVVDIPGRLTVHQPRQRQAVEAPAAERPRGYVRTIR